jgi:hypothetical protein
MEFGMEYGVQHREYTHNGEPLDIKGMLSLKSFSELEDAYHSSYGNLQELEGEME